MIKTLLILFIAMNFYAKTCYAGDDPIVAKIGDKTIHVSDFNRWISFAGEEGRKAIEKDPKRKASTLKQIITSMAVAEQAKKDGFDQRPDIKENMTLLIDNFLTVEYLDKVVAEKVVVTDDEVRLRYEEMKDQFRLPERVRTRHILVQISRTAPEEKRKKAREMAEDILRKVKSGGDFAELASEYSDDPGSKKKGGDVGFFAKGMMAPEFEAAAFSLKPGEVSDLVETNFGFHIIRMEEKAEPTFQAYKDVKEMLGTSILIEKKRKAVDDYVEKLSKERGVEIDVTPLFGGQTGPHAK